MRVDRAREIIIFFFFLKHFHVYMCMYSFSLSLSLSYDLEIGRSHRYVVTLFNNIATTRPIAFQRHFSFYTLADLHARRPEVVDRTYQYSYRLTLMHAHTRINILPDFRRRRYGDILYKTYVHTLQACMF